MKMEKERIKSRGSGAPWVWFEHDARFDFASQFVKDKVVIDCACGSGMGARKFANAGARHVYAFDIDQETISEATRKYQTNNLTFACASAYSLPLSISQADLFISLETIEHLEKDKKFIAEVNRVLQPDGLFICSTPNRDITNPGTRLRDKPWNSFHIREYSMDEFVALLENTFEIVDLYGQNIINQHRLRLSKFLYSYFGSIVAVRTNQIFKLPRFLIKNPKIHRVRTYNDDKYYEYIVACCSKRKTNTVTKIDTPNNT